MSTALTLQDQVFGLEREFNQVNTYKMNFAKEAQFALQLLQGNDYLLKAAQQNSAALEYAIINLASIGITLNPALKEAYLVPRGGKICLDISYIGLTKLATDTGSIEWVQAEIVKQNDVFEYQGVGKAPIHKMNPFSDRGAIIGVYCVARLSTGEHLSTIMSKADCDAIRDKSSQAAKSGPWVSFYEEMLKKTVIKRAAKLWPKSERVQRAAEIINEHEGIDFGNSKAPHVDSSSFSEPEPQKQDFADLREALKVKGKTERGLLEYLSKQFNSQLTDLDKLTGAQVDYAFRILGGRPASEVSA